MQKREDHKRQRYFYYFDSVEQYIKFIEETPDTYRVTKKCSITENPSWSGTDTIKDAFDLAKSKTIWKDGMNRLIKLRNTSFELELSGRQKELSYYHDVAGSLVDIGRYLDGEPECMIEFTETESDKRGKIVDIYFQSFISAGYSAVEYMEYGLAVYSVVDILESEGYRVNLYSSLAVQQGSGSNGYHYGVCVKIKDSSQQVEFNQMLFMVSHPAQFRRIHFSWLEKMELLWTNGYGMPVSMSNFTYKELMWFFDDNPNNSFYLREINNMPSNIKLTSESIRDYFYHSIKAQMKDIEEGKCEHLNDSTLLFKFTH